MNMIVVSDRDLLFNQPTLPLFREQLDMLKSSNCPFFSAMILRSIEHHYFQIKTHWL